MNRISRFMRTVLLLAGLALPWPAAAEVACHDNPRRIAEQRALDETQIADLLRERTQVPVPPRLHVLLEELLRVSPRLRDGPPVLLFAFADPEPNAYAADHGVILLTNALWDAKHAFSENELAAVLAHELAHVEVRDGLTEACEMQLRVGDAQTDIAQVRARLATLNPMSALAHNAADLLHEQELLADARGMVLLRATGRDPRVMLAVLAKLHAPSGPGGSFTLGHTHPALRERLEHAERQGLSDPAPPAPRAPSRR
jgi:Zn-dependent protease with chaperone function